MDTISTTAAEINRHLFTYRHRKGFHLQHAQRRLQFGATPIVPAFEVGAAKEALIQAGPVAAQRRRQLWAPGRQGVEEFVGPKAAQRWRRPKWLNVPLQRHQAGHVTV